MEELRSWLGDCEPRRLAGEELAFVVADIDDDALLGSVSLLRFAWKDRSSEVGYYLAPWARGRGVMTRAVRLLSRWALRELDIARLVIVADIDNQPSIRVAERCGFVREVVVRSFKARAGERVDGVLLSLLPTDVDPSAERRGPYGSGSSLSKCAISKPLGVVSPQDIKFRRL